MTDLGPLVVVVGTPRSGTSLTAGVLAAHGVWVGPDRDADEWNPKGYFENPHLRDLRLSGELTLPALRAAMVGYEGGPWLVKHTPTYWNFWRPLRPLYVCVRRPAQAVLRSRLRMGSYPTMAETRHHEVIARDTLVMNRLVKDHGALNVYPASLVKGDLRSIERVLTAMGIELHKSKVEDFMEVGLWDR